VKIIHGYVLKVIFSRLKLATGAWYVNNDNCLGYCSNFLFCWPNNGVIWVKVQTYSRVQVMSGPFVALLIKRSNIVTWTLSFW